MLHSVNDAEAPLIEGASFSGQRAVRGPQRGLLVPEFVTSKNVDTTTLILHRCFRDQASKADISGCLNGFISGHLAVPANHKMNIPGFEILAMFLFRNSIRQPVAAGGLCRTEGRAADDVSLLWIGVAPEHRRKGYGNALLRSLEHEAAISHNAHVLSLYTDYDWEGAAPARKMYESYGFEFESTFPAFWDKEQCRQVWYRKTCGC